MNILQKAIRSMYSLTGSFNDKLLKYYKQYGATSSVLQDAEKQYLIGRLGAKYLTNQDYWKELDAQFGDGLPLEVSDILRKYGSDAHLYTFGPGVPILGPELVVNGDFSNGVTGWASANASMSVVADELVVTATTQYGSVTQNVPTKIGATYQLTGVARLGTSASAYAKVRAESGGTQATQSITSTSSQRLLITFVATSAVTVVEMQNLSAGLGTYVIDSITFKEILGYSNTYSGFTAGNYFDSAGTTLASVDDSVGLVLDAAGSVGTDLLNGEGFFNSVGQWGYGSGWTFNNGNAHKTAGVQSNLTSADGVLVSPLNKTYLIEGDVIVNGGTIAVYPGGYDSAIITATGRFRAHVKVTNPLSDTRFYVQANAAFSGQVDNLVVREVTGIHATQSTPGYKPTLRKGIVNLLTWSNDLTNAAWGMFGGTSKTATTVTLGTSYTTGVYQTKSGVGVGTKVTAGFVLSGTPGYVVSINITDNGGAFSGTSVQVTLTSTPTLYAVSRTILESSCNAQLIDFGQATTVTVGGIGLFQGTLTAAQIIAAGGIPLTTTAPASSQAGVNYLEFDGVDDRLALGGPLFQMGDDFAIVASSSSKEVGALWRTVFAQSNATGGPRIALNSAQGTRQMAAVFRDDAGNLVQITGDTVSNTCVGTIRKVGNTKELRQNGVSKGTSVVPLGTATFTSCAIGELGGGSHDFHNGNINYVLVIKGTISDADLFVLEKFVAQLSGVQL